MKWNRILHRAAFALWFKVMDEFAFCIIFMSITCGELGDSWFS